ncbi:MAG: alpha/beta fold hydrolase [Polyangiaceae bacterium]|nr:alpha/beta fold hydrolase [Polyangiaceae bacterium]
MHVQQSGEGAPLLLLHGGGGIGANWQLIFHSAPSGYHLIVPDLRGHGRSTRSNEPMTFRQLALDVLALTESLHIPRFKAIGMSMGAKTLLHVATLEPERVEAMVLVSAAPYFPESTRAFMRVAATAPRTEQDWAQMHRWHVHGDEQIKAIWAMSEHFANNNEDMSFTPQRLSRIQAQTLLVHGDRDPLYPLNLAHEMSTAIPHSALWIIPNGGHSPIFGEMAPLFARKALAFLNGVPLEQASMPS